MSQPEHPRGQAGFTGAPDYSGYSGAPGPAGQQGPYQQGPYMPGPQYAAPAPPAQPPAQPGNPGASSNPAASSQPATSASSGWASLPIYLRVLAIVAMVSLIAASASVIWAMTGSQAQPDAEQSVAVADATEPITIPLNTDESAGQSTTPDEQSTGGAPADLGAIAIDISGERKPLDTQVEMFSGVMTFPGPAHVADDLADLDKTQVGNQWIVLPVSVQAGPDSDAIIDFEQWYFTTPDGKGYPLSLDALVRGGQTGGPVIVPKGQTSTGVLVFQVPAGQTTGILAQVSTVMAGQTTLYDIGLS